MISCNICGIVLAVTVNFSMPSYPFRGPRRASSHVRPAWYRSRWLPWGAAFLVIVMGLQFGRAIVNKYEIQTQVAKLQGDIHSYQQKNVELKQLISYLQSPAFQERQAKEKLNRQNPGETTVVVDSAEKASASQATKNNPSATPSNVIAWWNYLFGGDR